jgi:hypothetical protein
MCCANYHLLLYFSENSYRLTPSCNNVPTAVKLRHFKLGPSCVFMRYVWSKAIVFPFSRIGFLKEIFCGLCETGTDFIRFRNQFLKCSDYPVFVDAPCVRKVNILWSSTNQIIYLTTSNKNSSCTHS